MALFSSLVLCVVAACTQDVRPVAGHPAYAEGRGHGAAEAQDRTAAAADQPAAGASAAPAAGGGTAAQTGEITGGRGSVSSIPRELFSSRFVTCNQLIRFFKAFTMLQYTHYINIEIVYLTPFILHVLDFGMLVLF